MTMLRRTIPVAVTNLGEREVGIRMSTSTRARDGHILEPSGCKLDNYRTNPIVLWSHDTDHPVGNNQDIQVEGDCITARTVFAPAGISHKADETCGLVKADVIRAVSIGFIILEGEPIDAARPRGGIRATKWELLECSFVSIPSDTGAIVTARAAEPEDNAMSAIDRAQLRTRMLIADGKPKLRGLYDVAMLAYALGQLGYLHNDAIWEAECEGDNSPVPGMLGDALKQLGETLIAMTTEEVNELLDGHGVLDDGDDALPAAERTFIAGASGPRTRAWRRGVSAMRTRAGRALSTGNAKKLEDAAGHLTDAKKRADDAEANQSKASEHGDALSEAHTKAETAHDKMGDAIEAANGSAPADVAEHLAKVRQHHAKLGKHLDAIGERAAAIGDVQADAMGSMTGAKRCIGSATRCVRSVLDANNDTDTQDIQTNDGTDDSEGSENGRAMTLDYRKRQAALLELAQP